MEIFHSQGSIFTHSAILVYFLRFDILKILSVSPLPKMLSIGHFGRLKTMKPTVLKSHFNYSKELSKNFEEQIDFQNFQASV